MSEWQSIETAPVNEEFLAYGSYVYPGDEHPTIYYMIASLNGCLTWPFETAEGNHPHGFFSHWMPLPAAPVDNGDKAR
jgi:hypothetical protein